VTGRNKTAIEDHFDHSFELEETLFAKGKAAALETVRGMIHEPGTVAYVRQQEPAGLGHAVWCARHLIHDEPVAILLADDLILGPSCLAEMVASYQGGNMVAVMDVPKSETGSYGIITPGADHGQLIEVSGLLKNLIQQMPHQILVLLAAISLNQGFSPSLARKIAAPVTRCN
jgi:UTP--glucose-1-phosphate uridylyltransferase